MKDRERREDVEGGYGEIAVSSSRFLGWLDNFWYHYKWHTLGIAFAVFVILVCVLQTCSKESYDVKMVYAGSAAPTDEEISGLDQLMDLTVPNDFNGDGEKNAALLRHTIYSEEQIKAMEKQQISINRQYNSEEYDSFYSEIMAGSAAVYFLEPWIYEELKNNRNGEYLRSLSDVCGTLPEGALEDGYGVRLGDTELYKKYKVLGALPEDTVICMLTKLVNHKDKPYAESEEMFRALVG